MKKLSLLMHETALKKVISLVLAGCMLFGAAPLWCFDAVALEEPAPALQPFTIDFASCSKEGHSKDITHAKLNDHKWEYNAGASTGLQWLSATLNENGIYAKSSRWLDGSEFRHMAYNIQVPASGYYNIVATIGKIPDGGNIRFSVDGIVTQDYITGATAGTPITYVPQNLGNIYLSQGIHTVAFCITRASFCLVKDLSFTPVQIEDESKIEVLTEELQPILAGETASAEILAKVKGVKMPLAGVPITAISENSEIATAIVTTSADKLKTGLAVTGIAKGSTIINVGFKVNGISVNIPVSVTITVDENAPQPFIIDFAACYKNGHATDITHASLVDHDWEYNAGASTALQYLSATLTEHGVYSKSTKWLSTESRKTSYNIKVPADGYYNLKLLAGKCTDGGIIQFFVDDMLLKNYDTNLVTNTPIFYTEELGNTFLTKGAHTITFNMTRRSFILFEKLTLTPVVIENQESIEFTAAELQPIAVGNTANAELFAKVNGIKMSLAGVPITVVSENSEIATGMVINSEDKTTTSLAVTGHKDGTTIINVAFTVNGINISIPVLVTISNDAKETGVIFDFRKCGIEGHDTNIEHATIETHGWEWNKEKSSDSSKIKQIKVDSTGITAESSSIASNSNLFDFAIDLNIPEGGYYSLEYTGAKSNIAGWTRIIVDGNHQKGYDSYGTGSSAIVGDLFLTKGRHTILLQLTSATAICPAKIRFIEKELQPGEISFIAGSIKSMNTNVTVNLPLTVSMDGQSVDSAKTEIVASINDPKVAHVDVVVNANGKDKELQIQSLATGETVINVKLMSCGKEVANIEIPLKVKIPVFNNVELTADAKIIGLYTDGVQLYVNGLDADGEKLNLEGAKISYESKTPGTALVTDTGLVIPVNAGNAIIQATVTLPDGTSKSAQIDLLIKANKTKATLYPEEKVAAARENVQKYAWAKVYKDSVVKKADKYVDKEEQLWNMVTTQELPRGITVGYRHDPEAFTCRYCGEDLGAKYGQYSWIVDAINQPFKIQCPACRRKFPSNDFESFYKLGLDEHGNWSYEQAKAKNAELVAKGENGYLKNVLYPEKDEYIDEKTGKVKNPGIHNWGVDDGYGYKTGKSYNVGGKTIEECHTYIAYYNHWGLWHATGMIMDAVDYLQMAYLYTGEKKYGRVGAILLDRIADVYPEMYIAPYFPNFFNSDSSSPRGKAVGCIWECQPSKSLARAYDIFYPVMDDPTVVKFLSDKAKENKLENSKSSPDLIRQNCEDGILREIWKAVKEGNIEGNFGMHQSTVIDTAIVLDSMPETKEMIDWVFQTGGVRSNNGEFENTGGNLISHMVDKVSRDGLGNEAAPGYNNGWIGNLKILADGLATYKLFDDVNLYKYPKYVKMLSAALPMTMCRLYTPDIGDSGVTAGTQIQVGLVNIIKAYDETKDPKFAQFAYFLNGNTVNGLHRDIYSKNPEAIQSEILEIIRRYGEYDGFNKSIQMAGYGLSALRGGTYSPASVGINTVNTQRDFWMYYGIGAGYGGQHGHYDALNLGVDAYGLNMAPDNGYPEACDGGDKYLYWNRSTIAHNTVQVNSKRQQGIPINANPMHFDDSGKVKIMDVDAPMAYPGVTNTFRRTVVMVDASDEVSYGIDFFHIKGGDDHVYSFHALSQEIFETEGLNLEKQADQDGNYIGTYAGPDVPYGQASSVSGYSWLKNVRKDKKPASGEFAVDFKIMDNFRNMLPTRMDLHLRMTMLNDFNLTDVALVHAIPTQRNQNPEYLEQVLARRTGANLNTLFTTVLEPYKDERYIKDLEQVKVARVDGKLNTTDGDVVKAVKVTLSNSRVDYVVYATNNKVEYKVDDVFNFRGFIGVYTLTNGVPTYTYLNDGDKIGDYTSTAAYTGKVLDFTKELSLENTITVKFNEDIDVEKLAGTQIYVDNDGTQNAAYPIYGATSNNDGTVTLDLGDITLIRNSRSVVGMNATYSYNINEGQSFRIPLPTVSDTSPVFQPMRSQFAEVGSKLKFNIIANSPANKPLTYSANNLPYGAQFDSDTQTFSWIPSRGQIGKNIASFDVTDGTFTSTLHVPIRVYSETSGPNNNMDQNNPNNQNQNDNQDHNQTPDIKQSVEVKADAKLDKTSGVAAVEPKKDDVIKGINGAEKVIVNVSEVKDAKSYSVKLPADVVTNSSLNRDVEVKTPAGNIMLPTEMLANDASMVASKDAKVAVTLTKTDKTLKVDLAVNGKEYNWSNINVPVKIESTYKPSEEMKNTTCIIIIDAQGNIIPSGKYENGSITVYATKLGGEYSVSYNEKNFNDLDRHNWASEAITGLAARGIINGTSESTYSPANNITRADFITLVVRALGLKAESGDNFSDVNANDYFAKEVGIAKSLGIVTGQGDNKVNPKSQISREDMMVIVARALPKAGYKLEEDSAGKFTDSSSIAGYATESVNTLVSSGVVAGFNGKINPKGKTTRAEVAVLLSRIVFMAR